MKQWKLFFLFFFGEARKDNDSCTPDPSEENTGDKNAAAISVTFWRVRQLGEVFCSLCLAGKSDPPPSLPDPITDRSHAVTAGTIIYSRSALVVKGCEGAPGEKEFVQKECLWKWIYLRFSAPWELTQRRFLLLTAHLHRGPKEVRSERQASTTVPFFFLSI